MYINVELDVDKVSTEKVFPIWEPHNKQVCNEMANTVGILGKPRLSLTNERLHTLLLPYLYYCGELWMFPTKHMHNAKRAVRIIHHVDLSSKSTTCTCSWGYRNRSWKSRQQESLNENSQAHVLHCSHTINAEK